MVLVVGFLEKKEIRMGKEKDDRGDSVVQPQTYHGSRYRHNAKVYIDAVSGPNWHARNKAIKQSRLHVIDVNIDRINPGVCKHAQSEPHAEHC